MKLPAFLAGQILKIRSHIKIGREIAGRMGRYQIITAGTMIRNNCGYTNPGYPQIRRIHRCDPDIL
jgi:hypothetical protein